MSMRITLLSLAVVGLLATGLAAQDKTTPADRLRKALDQELKLDYNGGTLDEVMEHIQAKTKIRLQLDVAALNMVGIPNEQPVQFRGEGKVRQLLQRLLAPLNLTYVQMEDTLFITTEELGFLRQLRQRVPLDVQKQPLDKALTELARASGVNLVVDPRLANKAQVPVSLQLDDATVETSIRLLAEIGGMKAVRMGNVLFVTSEERAERIRKEEPQHPHMNGVPLPAIGGLFQGAFGGMAGGVQALPAIAPAQRDAPKEAPKEP